MSAGLRESLTEAEFSRLREAMNWVIPADSSLGAGTDAGVARLIELVDSQERSVAADYRRNLMALTEADLAGPTSAFALMFIEHVRDVYYAYPETGSWADIGFEVTDR